MADVTISGLTAAPNANIVDGTLVEISTGSGGSCYKATLLQILNYLAATFYKTSDATTALSAKANTTDVNNALANKANTSDVNTSLATKANASDVSQSFTNIVGGADVNHNTLGKLATLVDASTASSASNTTNISALTDANANRDFYGSFYGVR